MFFGTVELINADSEWRNGYVQLCRDNWIFVAKNSSLIAMSAPWPYSNRLSFPFRGSGSGSNSFTFGLFVYVNFDPNEMFVLWIGTSTVGLERWTRMVDRFTWFSCRKSAENVSRDWAFGKVMKFPRLVYSSVKFIPAGCSEIENFRDLKKLANFIWENFSSFDGRN